MFKAINDPHSVDIIRVDTHLNLSNRIRQVFIHVFASTLCFQQCCADYSPRIASSRINKSSDAYCLVLTLLSFTAAQSYFLFFSATNLEFATSITTPLFLDHAYYNVSRLPRERHDRSCRSWILCVRLTQDEIMSCWQPQIACLLSIVCFWRDKWYCAGES